MGGSKKKVKDVIGSTLTGGVSAIQTEREAKQEKKKEATEISNQQKIERERFAAKAAEERAIQAQAQESATIRAVAAQRAGEPGERGQFGISDDDELEKRKTVLGRG